MFQATMYVLCSKIWNECAGNLKIATEVKEHNTVSENTVGGYHTPFLITKATFTVQVLNFLENSVYILSK